MNEAMTGMMMSETVLECVAHQHGVDGWAYVAWRDANGWHYVASVRRPARLGGGWVVCGYGRGCSRLDAEADYLDGIAEPVRAAA